ncbi:MAG: hypothetical protein CSA82_02005 [Actinobacteria bacterium]|nr:MAG: hypothetical protein CSA82_02005 [Actinomycetota bacterium]
MTLSRGVRTLLGGSLLTVLFVMPQVPAYAHSSDSNTVEAPVSADQTVVAAEETVVNEAAEVLVDEASVAVKQRDNYVIVIGSTKAQSGSITHAQGLDDPVNNDAPSEKAEEEEETCSAISPFFIGSHLFEQPCWRWPGGAQEHSREEVLDDNKTQDREGIQPGQDAKDISEQMSGQLQPRPQPRSPHTPQGERQGRDMEKLPDSVLHPSDEDVVDPVPPTNPASPAPPVQQETPTVPVPPRSSQTPADPAEQTPGTPQTRQQPAPTPVPRTPSTQPSTPSTPQQPSQSRSQSTDAPASESAPQMLPQPGDNGSGATELGGDNETLNAAPPTPHGANDMWMGSALLMAVAVTGGAVLLIGGVLHLIGTRF